jgi:L-fuculose-phosphate aldolase
MTARELVVIGSRVLAAAGQDDMIWGHLSARDERDPATCWIKSAGQGLGEVVPESVHRVDDAGTVLSGTGKVHLEHHIHSQIYAVRPDVGAVVHSHAESVVVFAATGEPLRPLGHEGTLFTPPDIARFTLTGDLIHTRDLGVSLADSLGKRNAILLRHHGLVTVGPDVPTAVLTAIFLEKACRMQLAATPTSWSSDEEALAKRARCYSPSQLTAAWDHLVRNIVAD